MDPALGPTKANSARAHAAPWPQALIWSEGAGGDLPLLGLGRAERVQRNLARNGIAHIVSNDGQEQLQPGSTVLVIHSEAIFDPATIGWFALHLGPALEGVLLTSDEARHPAMVALRSAADLAGVTGFDALAGHARGARLSPPYGSVCVRVPTGERPDPMRTLWPLSRKPGERWNLRETRRWSFPVSAYLAARRVNPSTISWWSLWVALAGSVLLASGHYGAAIAGAGLLYASWVIDCLDGAVSRLTYQASPEGAKLDTDLGRAAYALTALALGWAAFGSRGAWREALLAIVVMVAGGVLAIVMGGRADAIPVRDRTSAWRLHVWIDNLLHRDNMLALVLFAALDRIAWFVWLAVLLVHLSWIIDSVVVWTKRTTGEQA